MELVTPAVCPALEEGVNPFVRRTYTILFGVLTGVVIFGFASYRWLPQNWVAPVGSADGLMWMLCGWFGWRRPVAFVLPVFSAINGLSLGLLAHSYPDVFLPASVLTLAAFAGLTVYVHVTKQDFSFLRGFLAVSFFVLFVGCILVPFSSSRIDHVGLAAFGTLVFLCWILYDTSEVIERAEWELTPGLAAFELLLDIIGLHSWVLDLLKETFGSPSGE